MPRTTAQNNAIKERRKQTVCKAALRLFSKQEFSKITIDDITQAAHCSHGLFYHYFKNQEDIFLAIEANLIGEENSKYRIDFAQLENHGNLNSFFSSLETILDGGENLIRYYEALARNDFDFKAVPSRYYKEEDKQSFCNFIEKAMEQKEIRGGNPKEIASLFLLMVKNNLRKNSRKKDVYFSLDTLKRIF